MPIKDLTVDDHNTALFVGNLSICNKFNESMRKWVSRRACPELFLYYSACSIILNNAVLKMRYRRILSVLACPVHLSPKASNSQDIALETAEDMWELLPDNSGNVIRHVSTGKYHGTSLIPLDSTVRLTDQVSLFLYAAMLWYFMIILESW